jgi:hypothetical protein
MASHVKSSSLATRQVIHVTSHCHANNVAQDEQNEMKKTTATLSTTSSLPSKSLSFESSALSDIRDDPGSPVAYKLVEQVLFSFLFFSFLFCRAPGS